MVDLAARQAIRAIMRALPKELADKALAEMEDGLRANAHMAASGELGQLIADVRTDISE